MRSFLQMIGFDLRCDIRGGAQYLSIATFYVLAISLFPMAIGPDTNMLTMLAPGLLVVCGLFATLMAQERMFRDDLKDGTLEGLVFSKAPYCVLIFAKIMAHWILTGLPCAIIAPVLGVMLGMDPMAALLAAPIMAGLTLVLSLLGAMLVSLSLRARKGAVLLALLALPLYIPMLIFGTSALDMARGMGIADAAVSILFMLAALAVLLPVSPLVCGAILRWVIED